MRKEIIIAIILGISIGGIVTYGIYRANQALINKATGNNPQTLTLPSPTPKTNNEVTLSILNPQNNTVISTDTINIEGKSIENGIVTISTDDQDFIVESDETGLFHQEIKLIKGANTIKITASDANTLSQTQIINLVYSTEIETETKTEK